MKRVLACLLTLILICSSAASSETAFSFTDDLGRMVVPGQPERTAALLGSYAQIWQLAGGDVAATAADAWEDLQLELSDDTVSIGSNHKPSLELLLSAEPDFILASTGSAVALEWESVFNSLGIPVAYFDISDFDDYLHMLEICTAITGRRDLYESNGLAVQAEIDRILEHSRDRLANSSSPKVLHITASATFIKAKATKGNLLGIMLKDLGCTNIADTDNSLLDNLSLEQILVSNPDYIFVVPHGNDEAGMQNFISETLTSHPAWQTLSAVRNGRVYYLDKMLYRLKPNRRWAEAYAGLEVLLSNEN